MVSDTVNYAYWDNSELLHNFDEKHVGSFFASEFELLKRVDIQTLDSVLDVGCSCGRFYELLAGLNFTGRFCGVDISQVVFL